MTPMPCPPRLAYDELASIEQMHHDAGRAVDTLGVPSPLDRAMLAAVRRLPDPSPCTPKGPR